MRNIQLKTLRNFQDDYQPNPAVSTIGGDGLHPKNFNGHLSNSDPNEEVEESIHEEIDQSGRGHNHQNQEYNHR
jgi:hypothetical protein